MGRILFMYLVMTQVCFTEPKLECQVQMEHWDGTVLDIRHLCHSWSIKSAATSFTRMWYHLISLPMAKAKSLTLHLAFWKLSKLVNNVGEVDSTQMETVKPFITALYSQDKEGISVETVWFHPLTRKKACERLPESMWKAIDQGHQLRVSTSHSLKSRMAFLFLWLHKVSQHPHNWLMSLDVSVKCKAMACECHKET